MSEITKDELKMIDPEHPEIKRKFILEIERDRPNIDPDLLEGTLTKFIFTDKSEKAFPTLTSWLKFIHKSDKSSNAPMVPMEPERTYKENVIRQYMSYLSKGSKGISNKMSPELLSEIKKGEDNAIARFLNNDTSTDVYHLLKEFEKQTFHSYDQLKKNNVINFINNYYQK